MNNEAGIFDFITDEYILAGVKDDLDLVDTTMYDFYLKDSINLGLKELKNVGLQIPCITQLEIVNLRAKLPKGFIRLLKRNPIVYVDAAGKAINGTGNNEVTVIATTVGGSNIGQTSFPTTSPVFHYSAPQFVNDTFFKESPYDVNFAIGGSVNLVNGWLYFSDDVISNFVKVSYLGANMDENGDLLIPSYCERALRAFAAYRFCRRFFEKYAAVLPDYKREWSNAKRECRGYAVLPDSMEYAFINQVMKSLI